MNLPIAIPFTDQQRRNAIAFLKRVPLKGDEAAALVELIHLLQKPAPIAQPENQNELTDPTR